MNFTGLSLDQAPPLSAPMRFFLTAPLFAMLAALLIFFSDAEVLSSRYALESIAVIHLFTIGFIAMVMFGALQQMLPVLAGVSIPQASLVATFSHGTISIGVLFMVFGLLENMSSALFIAILLLGLGFLTLLLAISLALKKVEFLTPTIRGMRWALFFATVILFLGMHLLSSYATGISGSYHLDFANIHAVLAIFGFAGILIIGVAFQVIPMFYVTPAFEMRYQKYMVLFTVLILLLWSVTNLFAPTYAWVAKLLLGAIFTLFGVLVIQKMGQRKRPIADITVYYWRLAGGMAIVGMLLWLASDFVEVDLHAYEAVIIGGGFIMAVMIGMLYKIIPFLVWFHLNGMGYMSIPSMGEMVHKKMALVQFFLYVGSIFLFVLAFWIPLFSQLAAMTLLLSMILLEINLVGAYRNYAKTCQRKPDFDMSAMS